MRCSGDGDGVGLSPRLHLQKLSGGLLGTRAPTGCPFTEAMVMASAISASRETFASWVVNNLSARLGVLT